jgi:hypothetical protein
MTDIKPIETRYKGYRFRSRLEARWAVAFEKSDFIKWQYEPEGFHLSNGEMYLPDFYLETYGCYAEVKPTPLNQKEADKLFQFVYDTGYHLLLLVGAPDYIPITSITKVKVEHQSFIDIEYREQRKLDSDPSKNKYNLLYTPHIGCKSCGKLLDFCGGIQMGVKVPWYIYTSCEGMFSPSKAISQQRLWSVPCGGEWENYGDFYYDDPIQQARAARFEHGETP